eukprot:5279694-Prymnesium_polylepis.2
MSLGCGYPVLLMRLHNAIQTREDRTRSPALARTAARGGALVTGPVVRRRDRPNDSRPDRMTIRRLTRTPGLPAGSLSALLALYGGAMRT